MKIGQQFKTSITFLDGSIEWITEIYTIYNITDKRICYTDNKSSLCGSTNRNVKGSWIGLEKFKKNILKGKTIFI
jgi:hypothetical protein